MVNFSGSIQRGQPLAFALNRFDADAAPDGLQDEFLGVCAYADIDKRDDIGAVGVPAFVKTARAHQEINIAVTGVQAFKKTLFFEAPDNFIACQNIFYEGWDSNRPN